jgi:DNA polymerase III subunit gamma/tau
MYVAIARKWRPQTFEEVVGQDEVVRALKNAISTGKIGHAYLFSGPRGTGKTTLARILAKSLNCVNGPTVNPCNKCENCVEIREGRSVDVIEIDGASNRKIDDVRNIREVVKFVPVKSRYKIYIIDEVHMLTDEAFNALLKTLEEPPSHVVFIFATTEPYKVKQTIRSRCQHFVLKPISTELIYQQLLKISKAEGFKITDSILLKVAKAGNGSMRDAESLLDMVVSYIGDRQDVTDEEIDRLLGVIDISHIERILSLISQKDVGGLIKLVNELRDKGFDLKKLCEELISTFRNLLIMKDFGVDRSLIRLSENEISVLERFKDSFRREEIIFIENTLIETYNEMRTSINELFSLEKGFFKIGNTENVITLSRILEELKELKSSLSSSQSPEVHSESGSGLSTVSTRLYESGLSESSSTKEESRVKQVVKNPIDEVLEEIDEMEFKKSLSQNDVLIEKIRNEIAGFFPGMERKVNISVDDEKVLIEDPYGIFKTDILKKEREEVIKKIGIITGRKVVIETGKKEAKVADSIKKSKESEVDRKKETNDVSSMVRTLFQAENVDFTKKS